MTSSTQAHRIITLSRWVNPRYYTIRQLLTLSCISYISLSTYYTSKYVAIDDVKVYHWTRVLSAACGWVGSLRVPKMLRSPIYGGFSSFYGVDVDDFIGSFEDYKTFGDFFARPVKVRSLLIISNINRKEKSTLQ